MFRCLSRCRRSACIAVLLLGGTLLPLGAGQAPAPGTNAPPAIVVDVVAADRTGAPVDDLTPDEFVVMVDGDRRRVAFVRYVSRGPGAIADARTLTLARSGSPGIEFAAEPSRAVLVVVDQTTILRGNEKAATAAVRTAIDRLGLDDKVGIARLPLVSGLAVTLDSDRPALFASLADIVGRASMGDLATPADPFAIEGAGPPVAGDPDRAGGAERAAAVETERPVADDARQAEAPDADGRVRSNLHDLRALFGSLEGTPGRKVVVVFSGGLTTVDRALLDETALAAARANAVVHAFGLRTSRLATGAPDAGALESLARATGGQFAALGRNVDQAVARVLGDLSSCYVLGLEGAGPARTKPRQSLRVTVSRPGVAVRAPAWIVSRPDAHDTRPQRPATAPSPPAGQAPDASATRDGSGAPGKPETAARAAGRTDRDAAKAQLLSRILARAADYVEAYQREFSSLVAEEDYGQGDWTAGASTRSQRLRSDVLLVRVDSVQGWVSFRDVFEVDGRPVRERDERLQRLFLDPSVESRTRLAAIQADSTRYNIGPVKRTVNSPLFPLTFLERPTQPRFLISLNGEKDVDGIRTWEVEYAETSSPTIAATEQGTDQPAKGRFLVDPVTGAVIESRTVYARANAGQIEYVVRYRRNEKLGLWLPDEMHETYSLNGRTQTQGVARYRNFRRFQVNTDVAVTVPK